ncbi:MAG: hypothetical protein AB2L13_13190 [Spirochaetota bacterium]
MLEAISAYVIPDSRLIKKTARERASADSRIRSIARSVSSISSRSAVLSGAPSRVCVKTGMRISTVLAAQMIYGKVPRDFIEQRSQVRVIDGALA